MSYSWRCHVPAFQQNKKGISYFIFLILRHTFFLRVRLNNFPLFKNYNLPSTTLKEFTTRRSYKQIKKKSVSNCMVDKLTINRNNGNRSGDTLHGKQATAELAAS